MHRSYVSKLWIDAYLDNNQERLPRDVEQRFFSVVRIKSDEEVAVFDGAGRQIVGALKKDGTGAYFFSARVIEEEPAKPAIVVLQAAIEDAKLSQTIQRGCEFGVDRFVIFPAERSDKFCFEKLKKRADRFMRIAEDAARQSGRLFIPSIEFETNLSDALAKTRAHECIGFFGEVAHNVRLSQILSQHVNREASYYVVIGPEGGLCESEKALLCSSGFLGVLWAPYVLRSELASLAAVSIINAYCGRG